MSINAFKNDKAPPKSNLCRSRQRYKDDNFEQALLNLASIDHNSPLHASLIYSLERGKRLRSHLCLALCDYYALPQETSFIAASVIEMIHAFSLIQDDLPCMDNDFFRRDRLCTHTKFDENTALLTANSLFSRAFELLSNQKIHKDPAIRNECIQLLASITGQKGMSLGQWYDLHPTSMDKTFLLETFRLKTGLLFAASLVLPSVLAEEDPKKRALLFNIGEQIGTLYQIRDDINDVETDKNHCLTNFKDDCNTHDILLLKTHLEKNLELTLQNNNDIGKVILENIKTWLI